MCTLFCAFNTCVSCITFFPGLAASHSSKDPPSLAYWLFASPHWTVCAGLVGVAQSAKMLLFDTQIIKCASLMLNSFAVFHKKRIRSRSVCKLFKSFHSLDELLWLPCKLQLPMLILPIIPSVVRLKRQSGHNKLFCWYTRLGAVCNSLNMLTAHYRKRGSASYIVREVQSVRERERERERETEVVRRK